jgi:hypothetical protein
VEKLKKVVQKKVKANKSVKVVALTKSQFTRSAMSKP